jgi:hypothetical protein
MLDFVYKNIKGEEDKYFRLFSTPITHPPRALTVALI